MGCRGELDCEETYYAASCTQLTLGLSFDEKGGVNYGDLSKISNRHVANTQTLRELRVRDLRTS